MQVGVAVWVGVASYLLGELEEVLGGCAAIQTEPLDGHLPVPVASRDLTQRAPPHPLHNAHVVVGDVPLVHQTVPVAQPHLPKLVIQLALALALALTLTLALRAAAVVGLRIGVIIRLRLQSHDKTRDMYNTVQCMDH